MVPLLVHSRVVGGFCVIYGVLTKGSCGVFLQVVLGFRKIVYCGFVRVLSMV